MQHPKGYSLRSRDLAKGRTADRIALLDACNGLGREVVRFLMLAVTSEYNKTSVNAGKYAVGSKLPKLTTIAAVLPDDGYIYYAGKEVMGSEELTGGGGAMQVR